MIREKKEQVKEEVEKKGVACSFFFVHGGAIFLKKRSKLEEDYRKKEQVEDKLGQKGASWYIDQGLKKGMKGEGERQKKD